MIGGFIAAVWGAATLANEFVSLDISYSNGQLSVNLRTIVPSALAASLGIFFFRIGMVVFLAPSDEKAMREVKKLGL